jgi:L-amino acid N-acyltransferase
MIIRQANSADAPAIALIWNEMIRTTSRTFTTAEKTVDGIEDDIERRGAGFQVAELNGDVVGFATYFPFRGGPGYARTQEHSIILSSAAQGQGIGRHLMAALEAEARKSGVHSLIAGVSGENPDGIHFHAAIGYREIARLPEVGYKFDRFMDLVLMQKFL